MKLLNRLRELRNPPTDFLIYDYSDTDTDTDTDTHVDNETIGIGAATSSDIVRLNLESHIFEKFHSPKK